MTARDVIAQALALSEAAPYVRAARARALRRTRRHPPRPVRRSLAEPKFVATTGDPHYDGTVADAEFIAAARTLLPALAKALGDVLDLAEDAERFDLARVVHTSHLRSTITAALSEVTP